MIREELAEYAHDAWSGWMKYLFKRSYDKRSDGCVLIPADLVERWQRQMKMPYHLLPENEKESDRKEADKMIELFKADRLRQLSSWHDTDQFYPVDISE